MTTGLKAGGHVRLSKNQERVFRDRAAGEE